MTQLPVSPVENLRAPLLSNNRVLDNCSSRSVPRSVLRGVKSRARRRGQALLISVLLMVFAAVLGATFVSVVALNLSQTARSSSVNTAREAAQSGVRFVNGELTNSLLGERWLPKYASNAGLPGDTYYYTDYERAQGWDQGGFVKFPDPRTTSITGDNSPTYLTKVETVPTGERTGQLKVTVIGRATDDDAASFTQTFYKPTTQNAGIASHSTYISNWNFGTNSMNVSALKAAAPLAATTIVVGMEFSNFQLGRTILFGDTSGTFFNIVTGVAIDSINKRVTLTLRDPLTAAVGAGETVRAAASFMGTLLSIDALGSDPPPPAQSTATPIQQGGVFVNAGMFLEGNSRLTLNTTGSTPNRVLVAGFIASSSSAGTIAEVSDGTTTENINATSVLKPFVRSQSTVEDPTNPNATVRALTPARIDAPDSRWLQMTKLSGDAGAENGYGGGVYINNRDDVEKVGFFKGSGINGYGITAWRPTTISETQRLLQRKSFAATGAEYGNVDNNPANIIFSTAPFSASKGEYAAGGAAHRLIYPRSVPSPPVGSLIYNFPLNPNVSQTQAPTLLRDPSLEERGLRGWVSPTEFLPRGALIELQGNQIVITRDDLSDQSRWARNSAGDVLNQQPIDTPATDASATPTPIPPLPNLEALRYNSAYNQPDPAKAWRNPNGSSLTGAGQPGAKTYRMVIDLTTGQRSVGAPGAMVNVGAATPFNGVIYADGNVRVRGFTDASSKDLTIVSMGNIYVEGGINQRSSSTGNVALLAKKNVILNPTQVVARVEGAKSSPITAALLPIVPSTSVSSVTLLNAGSENYFRVGDKFRVNSFDTPTSTKPGNIANDAAWHVITNISGSVINFFPSYTAGTAPSGTPYLSFLTYKDGQAFQPYFLTAGSSDIVTRDVKFDGADFTNPAVNPQSFHLSMLHQGFPVLGAVFNRQAGSPTTGQVSILASSSGSVKTLTLTPNGLPPVTTDLLAGIPVPTAPGATLPPAPVAGSLGALVWQFYNDDGGTTPPAGVTVANPAHANNGTRDIVSVAGTDAGGGAIMVPIYEEDDQNPDWDLFVPVALRNLSARRLISTTSKTVTPLSPVDTTTTPDSMPALDSTGTTGGGIKLGLSVGLFHTDPLLAFGSPVDFVGNSFTTPNFEHLETTNEAFYGGNVRSNIFFGNNSTLDPVGTNNNVFALRRDLSPDGVADVLPTYYLQTYKLDRADLASVESNPININVQATIYAQDGSWFVIPVPALTPFNSAPNAAEIDEANSNRRYNYRFTIQSRIAENFAPSALSDYDSEQTPDQSALATVGRGPQEAWLDASAYPISGSGNATTWQTINYVAPAALPANNKLLLPMTPDFFIER